MRLHRLLLCGVTLVAMGATRAAAQTYDACYVPSVGAIYLIKQAGLPAACLAPAHVPFAWTSGGSVADGSITLAKLAFDPATQAELDAVFAGLAAAGTINAAANPVDWTQLKNVPPGFADGTDDGAGGTADHGALTGLTDDDHAQYLLTDGVRNATNGFAVTGTFGTGTIPTTGNAVRLMWYPAKGAFRAGAPLLGSWNDANIGNYSVAMGGGPMANGAYSAAIGSGVIASGAYSAAHGFGTQASGDTATAMGNFTRASGASATALGWRTTASGSHSTALGDSTVASGFRAVAGGRRTTASGESALAFGDGSTASSPVATAFGLVTNSTGLASTAMGYETTASGSFSTAMNRRGRAIGDNATTMGFNAEASGVSSIGGGNSTVASGAQSLAMGWFSVASGDQATALGWYPTAQARASLVIGQYNVIQGSPTTWVGTDPLFVAGNGASLISTSNALTLLKNGHMTIAGTLTQSSDLRYKEDIEPLGSALDGVLRLEPIHYRFREGTGHPTDRQIGLGAQDVEPVFPELVHRDPQGKLSVAYTQLAAVLVRAVQEQQETIAALRAELAALRADVAALSRASK